MGSTNIVSVAPIPDTADVGLQRIGVGLNTLVTTAQTVIAAVSGQRIYVFGMVLSSTTNGQVGFLDVTPAGATVAILNGNSGRNLAMLASSPMVLPYQQYPWYTCAPGDSFCMNATGVTVGIGGNILFVQG